MGSNATDEFLAKNANPFVMLLTSKITCRANFKLRQVHLSSGMFGQLCKWTTFQLCKRTIKRCVCICTFAQTSVWTIVQVIFSHKCDNGPTDFLKGKAGSVVLITVPSRRFRHPDYLQSPFGDRSFAHTCWPKIPLGSLSPRTIATPKFAPEVADCAQPSIVMRQPPGVPFLYCHASHYLIKANPAPLPLPWTVTMYALLLTGYYIWDTANSQKNRWVVMAPLFFALFLI